MRTSPRYRSSTAASTSTDVLLQKRRAQLVAFYRKYSPAHVKHIDAILRTVQSGRITYADLVEMLQKKYGQSPAAVLDETRAA